MTPETLAKVGLAVQPAIFGLTLTDIEMVLRIILLCVGIASGVATYVYYRVKTRRERGQ